MCGSLIEREAYHRRVREEGEPITEEPEGREAYRKGARGGGDLIMESLTGKEFPRHRVIAVPRRRRAVGAAP